MNKNDWNKRTTAKEGGRGKIKRGKRSEGKNWKSREQFFKRNSTKNNR